MADLDMQEMKMFAKWHGTTGLEGNREFWNDCMSAYLNKTVILPMSDEPAEREAMLNLVKCPPGACGACCRYDRVSITREEYDILARGSREKVAVLSDAQGNLFLDSSHGCQFLKNNICEVYPFRPAVCRAFPIVTPKDAVSVDGTELKQIQIRLGCAAALEAVRILFVRVCATGKLVLLPDLSLVPAYESGHGVLGRI